MEIWFYSQTTTNAVIVPHETTAELLWNVQNFGAIRSGITTMQFSHGILVTIDQSLKWNCALPCSVLTWRTVDFAHIRHWYCGNDKITPLPVNQPWKSRVSCQNGPTSHAYAWQIGPFWQDTLKIWAAYKNLLGINNATTTTTNKTQQNCVCVYWICCAYNVCYHCRSMKLVNGFHAVFHTWLPFTIQFCNISLSTDWTLAMHNTKLKQTWMQSWREMIFTDIILIHVFIKRQM